MKRYRSFEELKSQTTTSSVNESIQNHFEEGLKNFIQLLKSSVITSSESKKKAVLSKSK